MRLNGTFRPPGDKSVSHRVALFSLLAAGDCRVSGYSTCADCASTLAAVSSLGGAVERCGETLLLHGAAGKVAATADLDCGNSGTTIRLLSGILAGCPGTYRLDGDDSLRRRPMERVALPLRLMGAVIETRDGTPPIHLYGGQLHGIDYTLPVASAQLKSAVLLAGLQAAGDTRITEPAPSRDHSERLLRSWGGRLQQDGAVITVSPSQLQLPEKFVVPGDVSGAAFFICGALLASGSRVTAADVLLNPSRTGWIDVLRRMGAPLEVTLTSEDPEPMGSIEAGFCSTLRGIEIPAPEIPNIVDEIPILALVATQAEGTTIFRQAGELRVKESDRLAAIICELGKLGADVRADGDDLIIRGPTPLHSPAGMLESYGDHRIAMTLSIASLLLRETISIRDADCAAVSYPDFSDTFQRLAHSQAECRS